jgi:purine nucleoside phosphorylase
LNGKTVAFLPGMENYTPYGPQTSMYEPIYLLQTVGVKRILALNSWSLREDYQPGEIVFADQSLTAPPAENNPSTPLQKPEFVTLSVAEPMPATTQNPNRRS